MKKYFFSIVALFAVTLTVMTFSSCSKDDEKEVKEPITYTYEAAVSEDLLKLYDVEAVAKYTNEAGDKSDTYAFTDSMTFAAMKLQSYVPGKKVSKKSFVAYKNSGATVSCNVKLKSNWKETLASMSTIYVCYTLDAFIGAEEYTCIEQGTISHDDATQEKLEAEAKVIANALSVK